VALFSLPVQEMAGRPLFDLLPDISGNVELVKILHRELSVDQLKRPSSYIVEAQLDREGPVLLLGLTLALMRDERGAPDGYLMTLRNLNALRSFHDQMMRADRLAALGTFAAGMAHEVRNPLASIKGMVQLMGEVGDSQDLSVYVDRIVQEIARLERLLTEMMNFAHPEQTAPEATDLVRLVRESLEVAESHCDPWKNGIQVRAELEPLSPCVIEPRKIHQALVNIIINAFEATPNGGEVVIRTRNRRDIKMELRPLVIEVTNTGTPIPNDETERIFEPFHTTKPTGTGLGLPIAYQIVTAHRGTLELEQDADSVTFRIALPEFPLGH
jgi:two-component system sensor histidine kinase PilS (NtrC family)